MTNTETFKSFQSGTNASSIADQRDQLYQDAGRWFQMLRNNGISNVMFYHRIKHIILPRYAKIYNLTADQNEYFVSMFDEQWKSFLDGDCNHLMSPISSGSFLTQLDPSNVEDC